MHCSILNVNKSWNKICLTSWFPWIMFTLSFCANVGCMDCQKLREIIKCIFICVLKMLWVLYEVCVSTWWQNFHFGWTNHYKKTYIARQLQQSCLSLFSLHALTLTTTSSVLVASSLTRPKSLLVCCYCQGGLGWEKKVNFCDFSPFWNEL